MHLFTGASILGVGRSRPPDFGQGLLGVAGGCGGRGSNF